MLSPLIVAVLGIPTVVVFVAGGLTAGWLARDWVVRRRNRVDREQASRIWADGAIEGFYELGPEGRFLEVNPSLVRLLGYASREELMSLSVEAMRMLYVDTRGRAEFCAALPEKSSVETREWEMCQKDGTKFWVEERLQAVRGKQGEIRCSRGFVSDISARKRAEKALNESEDRWRLAVQGSAAGIWEVNLLTKEAFYSDRSKELLGFAPNEISNNRADWVSRIHPDDVKLGIKATQDHLAGLAPYYQVEHRFLCKDGSYKWILSRARAVFDAHGRATRIVGTHIDVSERKHAEEQLRASESRYRILFEHSPVGVVEFDFGPGKQWLDQVQAEGAGSVAQQLARQADRDRQLRECFHFSSANAAALKLFGIFPADDPAEHEAQVMTPEVLASFEGFLFELAKGRHDFESDVTVTLSDESASRLHLRWWIPVVEGEPIFGHGQLALVDLTHLHMAEQALGEEREKLRVTLRTMSEGVVRLDREGLILFVNEAACALLDQTEDKLIGKPFAQHCETLNGLSRARLFFPVAAAMSEDRQIELPPQTILSRPDGSQRRIDGCCVPIHDRDERPVGAVVVLRDVTERAQMEEELRRASTIESVGLLAGGIAHDFNNILAVVMGNLTLALMEEAVRTGKAGRWLAEAETATMRARDLTQQLLTFSKGGNPVRSSVKLPDLVREAAAFAVHGASARCEFVMDDSIWAAEVDRAQIGQVVQNLVINAVQSMPSGGVIRISLQNEIVTPEMRLPLANSRYLKLTVVDQGLGITPGDLERIFEPYFTTKTTGSGLGLATVYSIVKKHQGHITVNSDSRSGTAFHVWLPAAESAAAPAPLPRPALVQIQGRVLFMDDEAPIREMAQVLLKRLGMEPTMAVNGTEALQFYQDARENGAPFDLVIMDLTVPGGMGGRETMERLRLLDPAVKAIVSSGYSSDPVMADYRGHGFQGVVAKPYRITDLSEVIQQILKGEVEV